MRIFFVFEGNRDLFNYLPLFCKKLGGIFSVGFVIIDQNRAKQSKLKKVYFLEYSKLTILVAVGFLNGNFDLIARITYQDANMICYGQITNFGRMAAPGLAKRINVLVISCEGSC